MKKFDKVKIMSYHDIKATFTRGKGNIYDNLRFVEEMEKWCGTSVTLVHTYKRENRHGYVWNVAENKWVWHEDWLYDWLYDPNEDFLSDKDFDI